MDKIKQLQEALDYCCNYVCDYGPRSERCDGCEIWEKTKEEAE